MPLNADLQSLVTAANSVIALNLPGPHTVVDTAVVALTAQLQGLVLASIPPATPASSSMPIVAECLPRVPLTPYTGPLTFTTATTIVGKAIAGVVVVNCPTGQTVSLVDCQIDGQYANVQGVIHQISGNVSLDHCEITNALVSCFAGNNLTANWCEFHNSQKDGLETGNNIVLNNCRIENFGYGIGVHADGWQLQNGGGTATNCYFGCLHQAVAGSPEWTVCAVFCDPIAGNIDGLTLNNCWFGGGCDYPFLIGIANGNTTTNVTIENCTFLGTVTGDGSPASATAYQFFLMDKDSSLTVTWTNNVDATGKQVNP